MQIYLLALTLLALAVTLVAIVRNIVGRRRAGEPWLAFGPEGAKREPVYTVASKPAPKDPVRSDPYPVHYLDPATDSAPSRAASGLGRRTLPGRAPAPVPPRPKAAPEGALAADVEARLAWAFDLLQTGKIPLESYVRIVESERDQVRIKLARLNEDGAADADERAGLDAALEAFGWCLDWADIRARAA